MNVFPFRFISCFCMTTSWWCIFGRPATRLCSHCILSGSTQFQFVPLVMRVTLMTWLKWLLPGLSPQKYSFLLFRELLQYKCPVPYQNLYVIYYVLFSTCLKYLFVWNHAFNFILMNYKLSLSLFILMLKLSDLARGTSVWLLCYFLAHPFHSFFKFLFLWKQF